MNFGKLIKEFENTDQTVKDFNLVFKKKIKAKETTKVKIGEIAGPDTVRYVRIGTRTRKFEF